MSRAPQTSICRALQTCICKASSALAAGHRRAPVSCRAYLRPPLRSGLRASGLQRRQGARSLRDRQLPTALPALDRTSTRRHGADNRPKGGSALRPAGNHFAAGRFPVPIPVGGTVLDSSFRNGTPFSLEVRRKHSPGGPFSIKMAKLVPPTKVTVPSRVR